jgi:hypothetical protein
MSAILRALTESGEDRKPCRYSRCVVRGITMQVEGLQNRGVLVSPSRK